jgi:hypothetical protein
MPEIPYLKVIGSKGSDIIGDCGICAIGTLCGKEYEDVVIAADKVSKKWRKGLWLKEIQAIALEFGFTLKRRRKYDLESDVGILAMEVDSKEGREAHVVVLNAGQLIDSDYTLWNPEAYISQFNAKLGMLLEPI